MFVSQRYRVSSNNKSCPSCPGIHYFNTLTLPIGISHESDVVWKLFDEFELFTIPLHHMGSIKAVFDALEQNIAIKKD